MRFRMLRMLALVGLIGALIAACGGDDPAPVAAPAAPAAAAAVPRSTPLPTPTAVPAAAPAAAPAPSAFEALLARAKLADDKQVVGWYDGTAPDVIRLWEKEFEAEFGIKITVASIPGHASRDAPIQALQAFKAGKAIADDQSGNADILLDLLHEGALRKPNWDAIYGVSPLIENYRGALNLETNTGASMSDWCMTSSFYVWPLSYNSNNVTAAELDGITFDDLAFNPIWKDRVITDARFLGVYSFPMAPGWDDPRQLAWVRGLRANGAKAVSGGSTGVVQALLSGEGDIAIASATTTLREKGKGAPVDWHAPADGWVPGGIGVTCFPQLTTTNHALADLWSAWQATVGVQLQADTTGSFVTAPGVVNDFTKKLSDLGMDLPANLVYAYKPADVANLGRWRQQAIDAFTE